MHLVDQFSNTPHPPERKQKILKKLKEKEKQNEKESYKPGKNCCAMEKPGVKGKYNKTSHQKKKLLPARPTLFN